MQIPCGENVDESSRRSRKDPIIDLRNFRYPAERARRIGRIIIVGGLALDSARGARHACIKSNARWRAYDTKMVWLVARSNAVEATGVAAAQPPLTAPAVSPATIWCWANMVSSKTGEVTMRAGAASGPQLSWSNEIML